MLGWGSEFHTLCRLVCSEHEIWREGEEMVVGGGEKGLEGVPRRQVCAEFGIPKEKENMES